MAIVTLIPVDGSKEFGGTLEPWPAGKKVELPEALSSCMRGVYNYLAGSIETERGVLSALYTVETRANESDPDERQQHEAWMKARGTHPGHIQGYASDSAGTVIYRIQSE